MLIATVTAADLNTAIETCTISLSRKVTTPDYFAPNTKWSAENYNKRVHYWNLFTRALLDKMNVKKFPAKIYISENKTDKNMFATAEKREFKADYLHAQQTPTGDWNWKRVAFAAANSKSQFQTEIRVYVFVDMCDEKSVEARAVDEKFSLASIYPLISLHCVSLSLIASFTF